MPNTIYIDALRSYREVIGQTLGYKIDHVAKCGITKPHANNNRVERLNGTLRERVKVQWGWKTDKSAITEGQRIYYNIIKPYQALDSKTPSEKVRINGNNKWIKLLKNSIRSLIALISIVFILSFSIDSIKINNALLISTHWSLVIRF